METQKIEPQKIGEKIISPQIPKQPTTTKKTTTKKQPKLNLPTKEQRKKILEKYKKFSDADKAQIKKLFESGLTIWEVTEKFFGMKLEHSRKYKNITWIFYQKINAVRHELNLTGKKPLVKNPTTTFAINTAIQKLGESRVQEILKEALMGKKSP